jgi:hypothetical protein
MHTLDATVQSCGHVGWCNPRFSLDILCVSCLRGWLLAVNAFCLDPAFLIVTATKVREAVGHRRRQAGVGVGAAAALRQVSRQLQCCRGSVCGRRSLDCGGLRWLLEVDGHNFAFDEEGAAAMKNPIRYWKRQRHIVDTVDLRRMSSSSTAATVTMDEGIIHAISVDPDFIDALSEQVSECQRAGFL